MNQEANLPDVDNGSARPGRGLSDEQISEILSSLPRETASANFTEGVMARVAQPQAAPVRAESSFSSRISGLTTLMFGPRPGFGMLLASSAAVAMVAGLAWSQFFGAASQNGRSGDAVASVEAEAGSAEALSSSPGTVRGTRVGTAGGATGFDRPVMPNGYLSEPYPAAGVDAELQADYLRLQRQLMLLRQLQNSQSPMVEIGTNGSVHYVIDLSDVMSGGASGDISNQNGDAEPPRF